ncbi:hypothetical protein KKI24_12080 [bacterium]|nr:hypothetical protein [bacterium]
MAIKMRSKVPDLQSKLYHLAKQSLLRKFGALYDKVYREDVLYEAWKRVRSNKGAAGIDGENIEYIEQEIGITRFLEELRQDLWCHDYKPCPVLRCYIEKPGAFEKRPLGIPVIRDRVVQMAVKLVIEPIFESNFLDCSYGFRPGKNTHQAIEFIRRKITFEGYKVVIDADIKGYFDTIN